MSKYKFNPNPFGAHVQIIKGVGKNKKVLEIGCTTGYISKSLKENDCTIIGIEIDEESVKVAKEYCGNVIVADVENLSELPYPEKYFDVLLFGDILEHLKDPLRVMRNLKRYLSSDGYIVASIPNVAHIYPRLKLLFGKWDYEDIGLLDRTHLRFFTKRSARRLISDAGFKIEKMDLAPWIPLFGLRKFKWGRALEYHIAKIRQTLFAFQFIIKARKME